MITAHQRDSIVDILTEQLRAIDACRHQIKPNPNDLGTTINAETGYQPSLDDLLKPWQLDPVGSGLRQGIRKVGKMIAPHITKDELLDICNDAGAQSQNAELSRAVINHMWDGLETSDGKTWRA
ncbi:hypothetical protein [Acetobacter syzygii]|uniref:hypothetical protein n=1 Tax=Acetobacter syzygii TaxID=146476 RepID=UPI0039E7ADD2